ncbi:YfhE family protein [Psychrobacillus sp. NPDC096389]
MKENKTPVEQLTTKDNGLSSTQEVLYQKEFKRASKGTSKKNQDKR